MGDDENAHVAAAIAASLDDQERKMTSHRGKHSPFHPPPPSHASQELAFFTDDPLLPPAEGTSNKRAAGGDDELDTWGGRAKAATGRTGGIWGGEGRGQSGTSSATGEAAEPSQWREVVG